MRLNVPRVSSKFYRYRKSSAAQRPNGAPFWEIGSKPFIARIVKVYLGNHDSIEKNIQGEPYEHGTMAVQTDCE